ncbi:MAG TPA: methyltransferase domain-containing protein [Burkholderiales bacterium]|nr:methyltransferase domain-containing protein [Burkholderiales bacterium]
MLSALCAGCGNWTGFGFRADGREMPRLKEALTLGTGAVVADVGAGKGELTFALASEVGSDGRVFSTDIDRDRVGRLREAVVAAKLDNVTVVEASSGETGLPPECCDAIVLRRVYHHLTEPARINASLFRALRPGGVLAIIDFPPPFFLSRGEFGVPADTVIGEVTSSGFQLQRRIDDWPGRGPLDSYCVVFRRP